MARIDQFVPAVAQGDGVTGGALLIRSLLRELGHDSRIFTQYAVADLPVEHYANFKDADCDLLLVHHSMGHELETWLRGRRCRRSLIYHNITPAEFFAPDSAEYHYALRGREQLARWRDDFERAIAVSQYNAQELTGAGYADVSVIPLVVGHERLLSVEPQRPVTGARQRGAGFLLAVGRVAENKRQQLLIEALWYLHRMLNDAPDLVIAGGTTSLPFEEQLRERSRELGLGERVHFAGKCGDNELRWYFEHAAALWHASAHEGFCVPLVEACAFGVPVIAVGTTNVPDTLGPAGLLLAEGDPAQLAAATATLLESNTLAATLASAAQRNLERYDRDLLRQALADWLSGKGSQACVPMAARV